ncbi:MAG: outer membrane protein transport protein [Deltaproteobacteria bacterium]|nr:outer membrane protein transport protein [Deltaproteobacteria bacterium]
MDRRSSFLRLAICIFSLAAVLGFSDIAVATNGMQVIGLGPVMRSMGGAGSALPIDTASIMVNPAGMSELGGRIDFGVVLFVPDSEYTATHTAGFGGTTVKESSDTGAAPMPCFGLVIPINDQLHFGVGAYGVAGMGVDYANSLYGNVVYTSFEMMRFAPALSYRINNMVSIGAALNLDYATMGYNAGRTAINTIEAHNKDSQLGYGFQVGILLKPSDQLSLALSYISKQSFPDFEFNTTVGKDKLDFDQPQNVILGLGYKVTPKLRIAADVKWINWDSTMDKGPQYTQNSSSSGAWNCNWEDQWVYAIGAEYDATDILKLRVGYNYGANPLPNNRAFEAIAFPAIQEHHYTAGVGVAIAKNVDVNLGLVYAPKVTMSGANTAQGVASYETSLSEYSFDIGLAYTF